MSEEIAAVKDTIAKVAGELLDDSNVGLTIRGRPSIMCLHLSFKALALGGSDDFPNFRLEYLAELLAASIGPNG